MVAERAPAGALGVDAEIYDADLYDACNHRGDDLPFYLACARAARGPVLELCCGSGRLTIPLARAGIDITGLDFTPAMLGRARRKARQAGLSLRLVRGDMRRASLGRRFKLVFIPFNSLQNTYAIRDVERVLANVRRHLAPGGRFVFDVFNPSLDYIVKAQRRAQRGRLAFRLPDGRRVSIDEHYRYDAARQTGRVTWVHHVGGRTFSARLDMRCFFPLEMDALLRYNGFRVLKKYGSFRREPFRSESAKQVYICRAAP
ncbi:MAG: class I SAM-dependent methyltransferase [Elusimicrobia bacterium]|nr:class I SAM-dependent methyltransferase [Elusimicrobiota bacterium]